MAIPRTVDVFCQVIDNFGDIGVSWRLARQLAAEHRLAVTLHVDDLGSFARICRDLDVTAAEQTIAGVRVCHWQTGQAMLAGPAPDLVIEAFGCRLPEATLQRMAASVRKPVWINLEYLSAEAWVEGCHGLASPHPSLPLVKHFFFPGLTAKTGGLLVERDLPARRDAFQSSSKERLAWIARLTGDHAVSPDTLIASLFCYAHAPVAQLLRAWQDGPRPVVCLVPEGVARGAVEAFLSGPATPGAWRQQGTLRVHVIPFLDQPDYDRLLWACDLNLVRGEDSFVRAQWAQRPFIWQIYPQEEGTHLVKLDAFLDRYVQSLPEPEGQLLRESFHAWNDRAPAVLDRPGWWRQLDATLPATGVHARQWAAALWRNGDLATNLIEFASKFG